MASDLQLETALFNADKAGDEAGARTLAAEIKRRRTPVETVLPSSNTPNWENYYAGLEGLNERVKPQQAAAFDALQRTSKEPKTAVMSAINQTFWQNHIRNLPSGSITSNWPTVRNVIGKEIFGRTGETSEENLYSMTGAHLKDTAFLRKIEYQNATPLERTTMIMEKFPHQFSMSTKEFIQEQSQPGIEVKEIKDAPNIPSLGVGNPALQAAVWNSFVKPTVEGMSSPLGLGTMAISGGLSAGKAAGVPLAKEGMGLIHGLFAAAMAHEVVKQTPETMEILQNPKAGFQDKVEAIGSVVTPMMFGTMAAFETAANLMPIKERQRFINQIEIAQNPEEVGRLLRREAEKSLTENQSRALIEAANEVEKLAMPEKISAAAIKDDNGNVHEGFFHDAIKATGEKGFVTNKGRFVDREEAMKIAKESDQINQSSLLKKELGSHMVTEFAEKISKKNPEEETPDFGIAERVTEQRAEEGKIAPVDPGEGRGAETLIEQGREALKKGADPKAIIDQFSKTKQVSGLDMAIVRAHGEKLAKAAYDAEEKFGSDSPEYKAAAQADSDWIKKIKPMQTESSDIFRAQQGVTEVDTGTFHGLQREFVNIAGREFTEKEAKQAKKIASNVKEATEAADEAQKPVLDALKRQKTPEGKTARVTILEKLSKEADAARERINKRLKEGRQMSGLDPEDLKDSAIIGADLIAKGVTKFAEWSESMVKDLGERIRPHLKAIFNEARKTHQNIENEVLGKTAGAVWKRAKEYIDKGESNFDDIRHKIAIDLGMPVEEVTQKLTEPKSIRNLTDEMYAKMSARRALVAQANAWVKQQSMPGWYRFATSLPRAFFKLATFGHGTVGMITHSGIDMFHPGRWAAYWPNFFRQFKLMGILDKGAFHEKMMQSIIRDPNFITAKRAGLKVDPTHFTDDYQNNWASTYFKKIGLSGNRGFDALKLYRMDRFNQVWEGLPDAVKTPDMAKLIADGINHESGAVKMQFKDWANWTFFAPKLEGSRWAWLVGDPAKATKILSEWKTATPAEKHFAISQVKEKAAIAGTYFTMLAANQGLLTATGSEQKINYTDPRKSDFLAFKAAGHKLGIISPMLGVVRFVANMIHASLGQRQGYENRETRVESMEKIGGDYLRGKLSPFAGVATDIATQSDFQKRPLPFSKDPVPASVRKQGLDRYTYGEYAGEHLMPIPVEEAIREVWRKQGMGESDIEHWMKALGSAALMGTTGARLTPDLPPREPAHTNR